MTMKFLTTAALVLGASMATGAQAATYEAQVVRTQFGIPHITAKNYRGIGYGQGYTFAQDNLCLLADKVVTVNGERSKHFGPDATTVIAFTDIKNLESDFFFRANTDIEVLRAGRAKGSAD